MTTKKGTKNWSGEVRWIKISTDIFDDEKIKIIEKMPEGDTIIIIWFKLLVQAGLINNNGLIYLKENIPYTDEMLSIIFDRPVAIIRLALQTFQKFGMIMISDTNTILLSNWEKYQNSEGLEKVREQGRLRIKKFREKQKQLLLSDNNNVTCNVTVTHGNGIEEEVEEEQEIEKEIDNVSNISCSSGSSNDFSQPQPPKSNEKLYGEYGNVFLTTERFNELSCLMLSKERVNSYIEKLSENIAVGKELPYKADLPDAHYIRIKKYYEWDKTHPNFGGPQTTSGYQTKEQVANDVISAAQDWVNERKD